MGRSERCVHELVAAQEAATPSATAICCDEIRWTYGELEARANQLAAELIARGVGPERIVGVCLERSADLVVALLGVLKAGGAYLPLDPESPRDRLDFMLADTGALLVLTREQLRARLPAHTPTLCMDLDWPAIAVHSADAPVTGVRAHHLAYVLYTSGSTGKPKAVAVEHRSVENLLEAIQKEVVLDPTDRWWATSSVSFDIAALEIFLPLITGASIELLTGASWEIAASLANRLARPRTRAVVQGTPSFWELAIECGFKPDAARCILSGGEPLSPRLADALQVADTRVLNVYGPTEATIWATCAPVHRGSPITLGAPLQGMHAYVLDAALRPVVGEAIGELYLGGAGVARGYLGRARLTAAAFLPDPFCGRPGARMYQTGDLVRRDPNGALVFVGRKDDQLKLRGYRIEPGEIEQVLCTHEQVASAAVVRVTPPGTQQAQLAAFVTARKKSAPMPRGDDEHIRGWSDIFDGHFENAAPVADPSFDTTGWISSSTLGPIPADDMREWLAATVERLRELAPQRVLDVGCGAGLVLFQLAGEVRSYVGTDVSRGALARARTALSRRPGLRHVELRPQAAHDTRGLAGPIDLVILNSVVQYFPSLEYLTLVLRAQQPLMATRGSIFLGDLRHLGLLELLHLELELERAVGTDELRAVRGRVQQRAASERELLVSPQLVRSLGQLLGAASVDVLLKPTRRRNELSTFRFDGILHFGEERPGIPAEEWQPWPEGGGMDDLRARLRRREVIAFRDVPNARTLPLSRIWEHAATPEAAVDTVDRVRAQLHVGGDAVDPAELHALGTSAGYRVRLSWSDARADGAFNAVFEPSGAPAHDSTRPVTGSSTSLANDPAKEVLARELRSALLDHLRTQLPSYMLPGSITLVDRMPLTPSGKTDRRALAALAPIGGPVLGAPEPTDPLEAVVLAQMQSVLGVVLGIEDDFFARGGDSLQAMRLVAKLQDRAAGLRLRDVFANRTARALAGRFRVLSAKPADPIPDQMLADAPLSYAQSRIWFLEQMNSGLPIYVVPIAFRLKGTLVQSALTDAITRLFVRHAVLDAVVETRDGVPWQVTHSRPPHLHVHDLRGSTDATARRQVDAAAQAPMDLSVGPLFRADVFQLGEDDSVLLLCLHHLVADDWSIDVLLRELEAFYSAALAGQEASLPMPLPYGEFARRQHATFALEGAALLDFWRAQLADAHDLALSTDRPRPAAFTYRGRDETAYVSGAVVAQVRRLAKDLRVTPFAVLFGAFASTLGWYAGQDDFIVGVPAAGRAQAGFERTVGLFVNTLPIRTRTLRTMTFAELVREQSARVLDAIEHEVPFDRIVSGLQATRSLSQSALVQALFTYHGPDVMRLKLAGLVAEPWVVATTTAKFDVTLNVTEEDDGMRLLLNYSSDLFDPPTAAALLDSVVQTLTAALARPDAPLNVLRSLARADEWLLRNVNETSAMGRSERCVHELVAAQAAATPSATAICCDEIRWTYGELEARANQLAAELIARGVGPERIVGVCLERSADLVVALLGVLKAGGAYLPLDPESPRDRLDFMLADTGALLVLTREQLRARLPAHTPTLCMDLDWPAIAVHSADAPVTGVRAHHLAYVLYTSGSTGKPKAVAVEHRSVVNYLDGVQGRLRLAEDASYAWCQPVTFDSSVTAIYGALTSGGILHALTDEVARDAHRFSAYLRDHAVDLLKITPSHLAALQLPGEPLPPLPRRRLVIGGEASLLGWAVGLRSGSCEVWNHYGPTETTVGVTMHFVRQDVSGASGTTPIGLPLANVTVHVLDPEMRPVPRGALGELYLGGTCVARGYLGRPALTAASFVPDPFTETPGARMYRTGDVVRMLADGTIEFLGRRDQQVKLRGRRIELGEIEATLGQHPAVAACVALLTTDGKTGGMLVAYVVPRGRLDEEEIREFLKSRVPDYMVPSRLIGLPELPRTAHGKIDRAHLPPPDLALTTSRPLDLVEDELASIWREVLGVGEVNASDDFFALGGDSLSAIRVVSRVRERLGGNLGVRVVFESPSLAEFAQRIQAGPDPAKT